MASKLPKPDEPSQEALASAFADFNKGMSAYVYVKTHNQAHSQDLVQDTFMKTWRYLVKGGKIDMMKPFLYHTLNNLIIDEYRKRKTVSLDTLLEKGYEPSINVIEQLENAFDGKIALDLLIHLSPVHQKVLRMKYVQGLTLEEMALITGCSRNTVAVQMHRGIAKLKELYKT